ncbi:MAG: hypothetical protein ACRCT1_00100, partial [Microcoleaceae cyanobacterium]
MRFKDIVLIVLVILAGISVWNVRFKHIVLSAPTAVYEGGTGMLRYLDDHQEPDESSPSVSKRL